MDSRPVPVPVQPWSVATSMVIYIILLSGVATTHQLDFVSLGIREAVKNYLADFFS